MLHLSCMAYGTSAIFTMISMVLVYLTICSHVNFLLWNPAHHPVFVSYNRIWL
jgi:hypothetical protein